MANIVRSFELAGLSWQVVSLESAVVVAESELVLLHFPSSSVASIHLEGVVGVNIVGSLLSYSEVMDTPSAEQFGIGAGGGGGRRFLLGRVWFG